MAIGGNQNQVGSGNFEGDPSKTGTTTFVQADPTFFRDLVQRLTGPQHDMPPQPKPAQKLHERRKYSKATKLEISKPNGFQFQASMQPKIPSTPAGAFGPYIRSSPVSPSGVTRMISPGPSTGVPPMAGSLKRMSSAPIELDSREEEKAIKEKRFYLHPSPRSKQRLSPKPELLTLFPLESPTGNGSSSN